MTREQIEKAALICAGAGEYGELPYNPDAKTGFIAGAGWRINSVWHDMVKEEPQVYGEYENEIAPSIPCLVPMITNATKTRLKNGHILTICFPKERRRSNEYDRALCNESFF